METKIHFFFSNQLKGRQMKNYLLNDKLLLLTGCAVSFTGPKEEKTSQSTSSKKEPLTSYRPVQRPDVKSWKPLRNLSRNIQRLRTRKIIYSSVLYPLR